MASRHLPARLPAAGRGDMAECRVPVPAARRRVASPVGPSCGRGLGGRPLVGTPQLARSSRNPLTRASEAAIRFPPLVGFGSGARRSLLGMLLWATAERPPPTALGDGLPPTFGGPALAGLPILRPVATASRCSRTKASEYAQFSLARQAERSPRWTHPGWRPRSRHGDRDPNEHLEDARQCVGVMRPIVRYAGWAVVPEADVISYLDEELAQLRFGNTSVCFRRSLDTDSSLIGRPLGASPRAPALLLRRGVRSSPWGGCAASIDLLDVPQERERVAPRTRRAALVPASARSTIAAARTTPPRTQPNPYFHLVGCSGGSVG